MNDCCETADVSKSAMERVIEVACATASHHKMIGEAWIV